MVKRTVQPTLKLQNVIALAQISVEKSIPKQVNITENAKNIEHLSSILQTAPPLQRVYNSIKNARTNHTHTQM